MFDTTRCRTKIKVEINKKENQTRSLYLNSIATVVSNTVVIRYVCMTEVGSSSNTVERKDKLCTSKTTKETESRLNSLDLNKYFNFAFNTYINCF